jgi:hypothetical protein
VGEIRETPVAAGEIAEVRPHRAVMKGVGDVRVVEIEGSGPLSPPRVEGAVREDEVERHAGHPTSGGGEEEVARRF